MDAVRELKGDMNNTDEELVVLRSVLWFLLEQTEGSQASRWSYRRR